MGMVVRTNTMANNAFRQLGMNNSALSKSLEKLSSGYRINRAADDAAGLAISEKMKAQITGLEAASANAEDGISLVQTAEGALNEVHDMLNRMAELATKAANGTYTDTQRGNYQDELTQLQSEIDRIADSTNFNSLNLLDGSLSAPKATLTDGTSTAAVAAEYTLDLSTITFDGGTEYLQINSVDIGKGTTGTGADNDAAILGELKVALSNYNVTSDGKGKFTITAKTPGVDANKAELTVTGQGTTLSTGAPQATETVTGAAQVDTAASSAVSLKGLNGATVIGGKINFGGTVGADGTITGGTTFKFVEEATGAADEIVVGKTDDAAAIAQKIADKVNGDGTLNATWTATADGNGGLTIDETAPAGTTTAVSINFEDVGGLVLQVGDTNDSFNKLTVSVQDMHADTLGVDAASISVKTAPEAGAAIKNINAAIDNVSKVRSSLGAIQNRLDHTVNNLDTTAENLNAANSRIRDTDMASEMMNYTQMSVLVQSAQAMLAQANQQPQAVLQLLQ